MYPPRLGILLLIPLWIGLAGVSASFAQQRRVYTNEDFPAPAPPPAAPSPAAKPAAPSAAPAAEGTPAAEGAPASAEEAKAEPDVPPVLKLSNSVETTLREYHTELAAQFDAETDPARQQRLQTMMDLTLQLIVQNQSFIADLKARQKQPESETQAQAGAQPAQ